MHLSDDPRDRLPALRCGQGIRPSCPLSGMISSLAGLVVSYRTTISYPIFLHEDDFTRPSAERRSTDAHKGLAGYPY